nr:hypothetical protein [Tanacetum cinerariifolium]
MGTVRETLAESTEGAPQFGPKQSRAYSDLTPKEKHRYNADIQAKNILLQGLPKDIYTLINHYTDAKDIWDNVKMLLEGSKLTKEDRESQLFVTAVKLNRGLRDSNYDQLYTYLKQHETHAKENKMMLERFSQPTVDPFALLSNYVKDNEVPVVHSDASSIPTDAFMMIYNDMCESHDQSISNPSWNTVVKNSLTAELAIYKEHVKLVAIGYKNPLCLTRAKQVQPALYNGHEIIKDNHAPSIVHNTEDTLEIAEITRKKMNAKMNDPECVTRKVKIAPHDYSKENFLATFTPQKQLTPEQIFWSNDLMKLKAKAPKEQTKVSRPIKALTVYSPNIPATLVPKVLPTKSQVKIHIFTLIQLFSEFDKTCKKRITPTGSLRGKGVLNKPRNATSK